MSGKKEKLMALFCLVNSTDLIFTKPKKGQGGGEKSKVNKKKRTVFHLGQCTSGSSLRHGNNHNNSIQFNSIQFYLYSAKS